MTISSSLLLLVGQNSQGGPVRYRGCWMLPYSQASHEHHERRCHGHSPNYDLARSRSRSVTSASVTPWTVARQPPLSVAFPRQEYWSGWPFPSPGDLPNPEIKPGSPALQADSLPTEPPGKLLASLRVSNYTFQASFWVNT